MKIICFMFFCFSFTFSFGQDTKILSEHKTLTYATDYSDSTNNIYIKDTVRFITTSIPWKYQPDKQITVIWKYSGLKLNDSIKRKLFSVGWSNIDSTGAIETNEQYWMHPTRNNHYTITEIAPFPLIELPASIGKKFSRKLKIYEGWGPWSNLILVNNYEIIGNETIVVDNNHFECWITKAQSESKLGKSELVTSYNNKVGFTKFQYSFYNKASLVLKLIKVEY